MSLSRSPWSLLALLFIASVIGCGHEATVVAPDPTVEEDIVPGGAMSEEEYAKAMEASARQ
ncbi:hypothetical protein [Roseiconus lacunae]|uniref:Secreted protein n=1 Tax=Roseiconus lacunae TaxID=2605694 RepID=A0ABT7PEZ3_9BACT|nr:hypothetical protein [Roseiconus lacunae]MCD0462877.1 hypothetical protein [Roseiconus lacunae]MDM4014869.1 hypothetical protein [Roseiconus lacunae]WRQ50458.1 hypothetical protein U8335_26340 [Stieleria sp. HD01]